jgi:hypothetical protein
MQQHPNGRAEGLRYGAMVEADLWRQASDHFGITFSDAPPRVAVLGEYSWRRY